MNNTNIENKKMFSTLLCSIFLGSGLIFLLPLMSGALMIGSLSGSPYVFAVVAAAFSFAVIIGFLIYILSSRLSEVYQFVVLLLPLLFFVFIAPYTNKRGFENIDNVCFPALTAFGLFFIKYGFLTSLMTAFLTKLIFWQYDDYKNIRRNYFSYMVLWIVGGGFSSLVTYFLFVEPVFLSSVRFGLWRIVYIMFVYTAFAGIFLKYYNQRVLLKKITKKQSKVSLSRLVISFKNNSRESFKLFSLTFIPTAFLIASISYLSSDMISSSSLWFAVVLSAFVGIKIGFCRLNTLVEKVISNLHFFIIGLLFIAKVVFLVSNVWIFFLILAAVFTVFAISSKEIKSYINDKCDIERKILFLLLGIMFAGVTFGLVLFNFVPELRAFMLVLSLSILIRPSSEIFTIQEKKSMLSFIAAILIFSIFWFLFGFSFSRDVLSLFLSFFFGSLFLCRKKTLRLFLSVFVLITLGSSMPNIERFVKEKTNFYGSYKITKNKNNFYYLYRGNQPKGSQIKISTMEKEPTGLVARKTPLGQIFQSFQAINRNWKVAVVGMGTGSLLCYASPNQEWTFFEPNPDLIEEVRSEKIITHFATCVHDKIKIIKGNPRQNIIKSAEKYDLIIFDDYVTSALPPYLITKTAIKKYFEKLNDNGLIVFNLTNDNLNYIQLFANQARSSIALGVYQLWFSPSSFEEIFHKVSEWGVLSRNINTIEKVITSGKWFMMQEQKEPDLWTDSHNSLFRVMRDPSAKYSELYFDKVTGFTKKITVKVVKSIVSLAVTISLIFK